MGERERRSSTIEWSSTEVCKGSKVREFKDYVCEVHDKNGMLECNKCVHSINGTSWEGRLEDNGRLVVVIGNIEKCKGWR